MALKLYGLILSVVGFPMVGHAFLQSPQRSGPAATAYPVPTTVRVVRDLVYATYDDRRLRLDIYLPAESNHRAPAPGVVVVRGGHWRSGDKEAFGFIAGYLASEGFVAASIEYRTSAEAKFPAAVHDVKAAVRWLRAHAPTYGANPNAIGALGGSAGAHLVAMLATSAGVKDFEGEGGNLATSSEVQAAVAMACVCNLQWKDVAVTEFVGAALEARVKAIEIASPVTYVSKRSAPLLLLHSESDPIVPFAQSVEIETLYLRVGVPVSLQRINAPNTHGFWNEASYFSETMKQAVEFFRLHLPRTN